MSVTKAFEKPEEMTSLGGPRTRQTLIEAAAKALSALPAEDLIGIAASDTAQFVQTVRRTYRANGFNFTDSDIRTIHELVRGYAAIHINAHSGTLQPKVSIS